MAMLPSAFNQSDNHGEMNSFEALPAGDYNIQVIESELKLTKKGQEFMEQRGCTEQEAIAHASQLILTYEILDGQFKGRKLFNRLNLFNPSERSVEIAQKELNTICKAVGLSSVSDSNELHMKPMCAKVGQRGKPEDQYGVQNTFKNYNRSRVKSLLVKFGFVDLGYYIYPKLKGHESRRN